MLKTRVITSCVLIAGFLAVLLFASNLAWALLALTVASIGMWEWSNLIKLNSVQTKVSIGTVAVVGLLLIYIAGTEFNLFYHAFTLATLVAVAIFWVLLAPVWLITRKSIKHQYAMTLLGMLLLLSTWVGLVGLHHLSPLVLLAVLATVWIADSAAYFAGKRFGRNKLAPEISPGKTWEGVAGAIIGVTAYGLILSYYMHYSLSLSLVLILMLWLIVVFSIMGDLFESLLKRQAGIKDSSQLLPGHGGVLDRIDGLIPSLPLVLFAIYFPLYSPIISNLNLHA